MSRGYRNPYAKRLSDIERLSDAEFVDMIMREKRDQEYAKVKPFVPNFNNAPRRRVPVWPLPNMSQDQLSSLRQARDEVFNTKKRKKRKMHVNNSLLAPLLLDHVNLINVNIMKENGTFDGNFYTYKCPFPVKKDDIVLVQTYGTYKPALVKSIDVPMPDITEAEKEYKWAIAKIDSEYVNKLVNDEKSLINQVNMKRATGIRQNMLAMLGIGADDELLKISLGNTDVEDAETVDDAK